MSTVLNNICMGKYDSVVWIMDYDGFYDVMYSTWCEKLCPSSYFDWEDNMRCNANTKKDLGTCVGLIMWIKRTYVE